MSRNIREASSVILMASRLKPYRTPYNYDILTLKRSKESSFMPNGIVFPGGTVDAIDSDERWLELFKTHGVAKERLMDFPDERTLPELFRTKSVRSISKHISLRITALRETFEETGVLLCKKPEFVNRPNSDLYANAIESERLQDWRNKIQKDPSAFLYLYSEIKCVPDIWALKLWSNWITPATISKRFDTAFFTACLQQRPSALGDNTEISQLDWISPDNLSSMSINKQIWLPPPQKYEVSRLLPFFMLEDLALFASEREKLGCEAFEPIHHKAKDGTFFSLPGDDLHNNKDEREDENVTLDENREAMTSVHRMEVRDQVLSFHMINYKPKFGHIMPFTSNTKC